MTITLAPMAFACLQQMRGQWFGVHPRITPGWVRTFFTEWPCNCEKAERELGYLSAENGHYLLPFILGGYTKGPKSLVYSAPLLSWYVNSNQHKGFAFMAPFIVYDIDTIYYASDNRMAGYSNLTYWFLGILGSTQSLTGVQRGEEVEQSSYWFFPLFKGGVDEEGSYFDLLMVIPIF